MTEPVMPTSAARRWFWRMGMIAIVIAAVLWFALPFEPGRKTQALPPVAPSTDWAAVPAGPAVPLNLPKTPMTNAPDDKKPDKAP